MKDMVIVGTALFGEVVRDYIHEYTDFKVQAFSCHERVKPALANAMMDLCLTRDVSFATVIDTPFADNETVFKNVMSFQFSDE
jgi:hypothetical protein